MLLPELRDKLLERELERMRLESAETPLRTSPSSRRTAFTIPIPRWSHAGPPTTAAGTVPLTPTSTYSVRANPASHPGHHDIQVTSRQR